MAAATSIQIREALKSEDVDHALKQLIDPCSSAVPEASCLPKCLELFDLIIDEILRIFTSDDCTLAEILKCLKQYFVCEDVKQEVLKHLEMLIADSKEIFNAGIIFALLRSIPEPLEKDRKFFCNYRDQGKIVRKFVKFARMKISYTNCWTNLTKRQLKPLVHKRLLVFIPDHVMANVNDAKLFADFFIRSYQRGDPYNLLALNGLFQLMHLHNLDYPDFYSQLYSLLRPSILTTKHRQRFFALLDKFLQSTHLPSALVAAFVKRLARLALIAPIDMCLFLIKFDENLLIRHQSLKCLIDDPKETCVESDPYEAAESDPSKSRAIESSLWEMKTLQNHAYHKVAEAAKFIDRALPELEFPLLEVENLKEMFEAEMEKEFEEVPSNFTKPTNLFDSKIFKFDEFWSME